MARKRKIQILRAKSLTDVHLDYGEMGLHLSEDGLSIKLYIGIPDGKKVWIGSDFDSELFKDLITKGTIDDSVLAKIESALQASNIGNGFVISEDKYNLGTPSSITDVSVNNVTANSHSHLLVDGSITNQKLAMIPANTLKGGLEGGFPTDLTVSQARTLLNINNVLNQDSSNADNIVSGTLSIDRIANQSITQNKIDPAVLALMTGSGFLTEESDPSVADWARKPNVKPSYTVSEIDGAISMTEINKLKDDLMLEIQASGNVPTWDEPTSSLKWGDSTTIPIPIRNLVRDIAASPSGLTVTKFDGATNTVNVTSAIPTGSITQSMLDVNVNNLLNSSGGGYVLPSGGIPKSDLSDDVIWSLLPIGGRPLQFPRMSEDMSSVEWVNLTGSSGSNIDIQFQDNSIQAILKSNLPLDDITYNNIISIVYPVGSVYTTIDSELNPEDILVGSWKYIGDTILTDGETEVFLWKRLPEEDEGGGEG
jgi:hypothetical protein